ncbi:MAG TPA: amidohydrolase family protein [Bryobacteraceae bacterium]|nr:amidohydrolase family protein [Bryobacteraceae bacterium]
MNDPIGNHEIRRRDILKRTGAAAAGLMYGANQSAGQIPTAAKGMRIDVHAHVWTDEYLNMMERFGVQDTSVQRNKGSGPSQAEMDKRFAQMDAAKVSMQILSICPQAPHFEDKANAVAAARAANDLFADVVRRWPKRFAAFAALPLPHVDEALKELDRAIGQLGFIGATITTFVAGRSPATAAFAPLYEELNRRGTVLFIHPAGCAIYSPMISDHHMTWMVGAPIEDTVSILHLIEAGIPLKYPKLKIINAHLGGALPMVYQRLDNQYVWENPKFPEKPSIAAKRMWYDSVGHGHIPALRAAVETLGADRIVLGTDFPYESGALYQRAVDYIGLAGLKREDAARILDHNAAAVLGMA